MLNMVPMMASCMLMIHSDDRDAFSIFSYRVPGHDDDDDDDDDNDDDNNNDNDNDNNDDNDDDDNDDDGTQI